MLPRHETETISRLLEQWRSFLSLLVQYRSRSKFMVSAHQCLIIHTESPIKLSDPFGNSEVSQRPCFILHSSWRKVSGIGLICIPFLSLILLKHSKFAFRKQNINRNTMISHWHLKQCINCARDRVIACHLIGKKK